MVAKLFKYEMSFYAKIMFPFLILMPISAIPNRVVLAFAPEISTESAVQ